MGTSENNQIPPGTVRSRRGGEEAAAHAAAGGPHCQRCGSTSSGGTMGARADPCEFAVRPGLPARPARASRHRRRYRGQPRPQRAQFKRAGRTRWSRLAGRGVNLHERWGTGTSIVEPHGLISHRSNRWRNRLASAAGSRPLRCSAGARLSRDLDYPFGSSCRDGELDRHEAAPDPTGRGHDGLAGNRGGAQQQRSSAASGPDHAAVLFGVYAPNGFGMHDLHGNVWE